MSKFFMQINGVDILPYVDWSGVKYQVNALDSDEAGRSLDGKMHRSMVGMKARWDITTKKLTTDDLHTLLQLIAPEWISLHTYDLQRGEATYNVYSNNYNIELEASGLNVDGELLWKEFTFPLIEE